MSQGKIELPNIADRRQIHLINPRSCAGKHAEKAKRLAASTGSEVVLTERPGFAEEYAAELFRKDPFAHLVLYGGDGTVCEAVNGIMRSGNAHLASFSVIPFGSGNDFSAYANDGAGFRKAELVRLDVCQANGRYFINMVNVGFDCAVVRQTDSFKKVPFLRGKAVYLAGVAAELVKKTTVRAKVTLDGEMEREEPLLLSLAANGQYYGGGFRAAPLASMTDGRMDVLLVREMSRRRFLSLVGDYKAGAYIQPDGTIREAFADWMTYRRVQTYRVSGVSHYCVDGEVYPAPDGEVTVRCIPGAVWFAPL